MAKLKAKLDVMVKFPTNGMRSGLMDLKADLEQAASEQVAADIALVEATNAVIDAGKLQEAAVARKTKAERALSNLRNKLAATL